VANKKNKKMKKKKPSQRHISKSAELDRGRGFSGIFFFTRMETRPKIL